MVIGEPGYLGRIALPPVTKELKIEQDIVTTLHLPLMVKHAMDQLWILRLALKNHVQVCIYTCC